MKIRSESCDSIDALKFRIQEQCGLAVDRQRLIYSGRQLDDGRTLSGMPASGYSFEPC